MNKNIVSFFLFFIPFILIISMGFSNARNYPNTKIQIQNRLDTIEFSLDLDFARDCEGECYKKITNSSISKVIGEDNEGICNHLFVACSSNLKFNKDRTYRFLASKLDPNGCPLSIDTCIKNRYFLLVRQINR